MIGSDFYGATELLGLSDEQIVEKVVHNVQRCDPRALGAKVCAPLPVCLHAFQATRGIAVSGLS